jgi:hypothetical protein
MKTSRWIPMFHINVLLSSSGILFPMNYTYGVLSIIQAGWGGDAQIIEKKWIIQTLHCIHQLLLYLDTD